MSLRRTGVPGRGRGYVLVGALFLMFVMAISLTVVAREWSFIHRRALEQELKFRGDRIMRAILEYRQMQAAGLKQPLEIKNYETLVKALTDQPHPVLLEVPSDPMTARYDEEGKLLEDSGQWGLVVQTGAQRTETRRGTTRQAQGGLQISGCPPLQQPEGEPEGEIGGGLMGDLPSVFDDDPRRRRRLGSRGLRPGIGGGSGSDRQVQGTVVGVVTCFDDPERPPIALAPNGEEAQTYRDWLFVPKEVGGTQFGGSAGSGTVPTGVGSNSSFQSNRRGNQRGAVRGGTTRQVQGRGGSTAAGMGLGNWANNWPASMPAPPAVAGQGQPGTPGGTRTGSGLGGARRDPGAVPPRNRRPPRSRP